MPRRDPRVALEILERRKNTARRYLRGETQWEIARSLEVDQGTVSRDLKAVRQEWLASAICDLDAKKAAELAKVDQLERTYWEAWAKSQEPKETTSTEKDEGTNTRRLKAGLRKEQRDGNPEFLKGVERCIEQRCKILGVLAPTKVAPTDPKGERPYDAGVGGAGALAAALRAAVDQLGGTPSAGLGGHAGGEADSPLAPGVGPATDGVPELG